MGNYYIVAKKDLGPEHTHNSEWPKIIAYSLRSKKFLISEGKGCGCEGIAIPELRALEKKWHEFFMALDAQWFLKINESENNLSEDELVAIIQSKTGSLEIITA